MNLFIDAVRQANEKNWCTARWCTTCGHRDFVSAITNKNIFLKSTLRSELSSLIFSELYNYPNWADCICSAFWRRPVLSRAEKQTILNDWLERFEVEDDFGLPVADVVLFYIIQHQPLDDTIIKRWIDFCFGRAQATFNESLIESLVYVTRTRLHAKDSILQFAQEVYLPLVDIALEKVLPKST